MGDNGPIIIIIMSRYNDLMIVDWLARVDPNYHTTDW